MRSTLPQAKHQYTTCRKCSMKISFGLSDIKRELSGKAYVYCNNNVPGQAKKCWAKNYTV